MTSLRYFSAALAAAAIILGVSSPASAMTNFSRKYSVPCATCHSSWPKLNDVGVQFKLNGYQLPDSQDGGQASKVPLTESLFLDVSPANPPVSIIMYGGATLIQPDNGYKGKQEGKFFCCVDGNDVTLEVAGSAAPNIAYRISLPWGKENISQGYLRFTNLFSPGFLGVDLGLMNVIDNDVVSDKDSWFAVPLPAYWGSAYHPGSAPIGLGAHISDTGGRIYGRPNYGMFTYEVGSFTGAGITGRQEDDNAQAYTIMGRVDGENISFSLRHWGNKSAWRNREANLPSGEKLTFVADSSVLDEKTDQLILGVRYSDPKFVVDLVADRTTYSLVQPRNIMDGETVIHSLEVSPQNRSAFSLGLTYIFNQWMEGGIAASVINMEKYTTTLDGVMVEMDAVSTTVGQLRFTFSPAVNTRIALEAQMDLTGAEGRVGADGLEYDVQNKLVLQWQLVL